MKMIVEKNEEEEEITKKLEKINFISVAGTGCCVYMLCTSVGHKHTGHKHTCYATTNHNNYELS